jgi:DALR anticodon binding domain
MIPGDIGAELARAIDAAVADGELPPGARARSSAAGTWRPAPAAAGGGPRTYATSLPFVLAEATGLAAVPVAARLANRLRCVSWITAASVTGDGYLTVTVTTDTLAALAVRVTQAGDRCACSDALAGTECSRPDGAALASAVTWAQAWRRVTGVATALLAAAAGAKVKVKTDPERPVGAGPAGAAGHVRGEPGVAGARPGPAGAAGRVGGEPGVAGAGPGPHGLADPGIPESGPVAAAVAFAGEDAIRYALIRTRTGRGVRIDARSSVRQVLDNPFFAVCFAHADAVSMMRWAGDLGLGCGTPGEFEPSLLALAPEQRLLAAISWLPERAAGAARRGQPHEFARHLEGLAWAYLDCRDGCPALPFLGSSAPRTTAGIGVRLWLASAAGAALGAGLRLLGIDPPDRV